MTTVTSRTVEADFMRLSKLVRVTDAAYKQASIEQWTADPCGEVAASGETGTRAYFESLDRARVDYAPWMAEALGYAGSTGLDVLDVGCGQGIDLARYARAGARATGIDLTPRHVELARAHLAAVGLDGAVVEGDAERLPFADGSFDRVSSNGVLHHTPDIAAALCEIRRVLRPGGEARIIVYNRASLHYWLDQVLLSGIVKRRLFAEGSMEGVMSAGVEHSTVGARPLVRVYAPRRLRRLLSDAGFADVGTKVRGFNAEDTFVTGFLGRVPVSSALALERIGRVAGWYVIGSGRS
jgi:ubiquinone/menaquinone biosynthesis C-methylase UbiE